MKLIITSVAFLFVISGFVRGQEVTKNDPVNLHLISDISGGNSYITFPTDIGNIEPLWFEAGLKPAFRLRKSRDSRLMGVLNPNVILRMYRERSYPVRTPSYMPQVTVYYLLDRGSDGRTLTLFGRYGHHSNGQDSSFYLGNGEINLLSGDFATNYAEGGMILSRKMTSLNAYRFFSSSLEVHPESMVADELIGHYSRFRWHNVITIMKLPNPAGNETEKRPLFSVRGEVIWQAGAYNDLTAFSPERINLSATIFYHPAFLEDLGLFVTYYHGNDYYNIYFNHRLDVLRFGLMTQNLKF